MQKFFSGSCSFCSYMYSCLRSVVQYTLILLVHVNYNTHNLCVDKAVGTASGAKTKFFIKEKTTNSPFIGFSITSRPRIYNPVIFHTYTYTRRILLDIHWIEFRHWGKCSDIWSFLNQTSKLANKENRQPVELNSLDLTL